MRRRRQPVTFSPALKLNCDWCESQQPFPTQLNDSGQTLTCLVKNCPPPLCLLNGLRLSSAAVSGCWNAPNNLASVCLSLGELKWSTSAPSPSEYRRPWNIHSGSFSSDRVMPSNEAGAT